MNHFYILAIDYYIKKFTYEFNRFCRFLCESWAGRQLLYFLETKEYKTVEYIKSIIINIFKNLTERYYSSSLYTVYYKRIEDLYNEYDDKYEEFKKN